MQNENGGPFFLNQGASAVKVLTFNVFPFKNVFLLTKRIVVIVMHVQQHEINKFFKYLECYDFI